MTRAENFPYATPGNHHGRDGDKWRSDLYCAGLVQ
jgi:hypothetical protein